MAESGYPEIAAEAAEQGFNPVFEIALLRAYTVDRFDPVRFQFIETLARRALQHPSPVRRILERKLFDSLAAYRERFTLAQSDASAMIERITTQSPETAEVLQQLFVAGDFREISNFVAGIQKTGHRSALAELTHRLAQYTLDNMEDSVDGVSASRSELKTIRYFRNTWSKLSVDKQLAQAIEQAPENAGPINSHMLVLRSLALMRDISPNYLQRFMSYADTLLWLDQAAMKDKPAIKKPLAAKLKKK